MDKSVYSTSNSSATYSEVSVKTPGYKALRKSGAHLPVNPYRANRTERVYPTRLTYNGYVTGNPGFQNALSVATNGSFQALGRTSYTEPMSSLIARAQNEVVQRTREKDIDLGVALGEFHETCELFYTHAKRIVRMVNTLRHKNVLDAVQSALGHYDKGNNTKPLRDLPKTIRDLYLETVFGVVPLVNDMTDAAKHVNRLNGVKTIVHRASKRISSDFDLSHSTSEEMFRASGQTRVSSVITYTVENAFLHELDELGLVNPIQVAYQLVPFSFVLDWFIPIGSFLSGVVPPQGIAFRDGSTTTTFDGASSHSTDIAPLKTVSGSPDLVHDPNQVGYSALEERRDIYVERKVLSTFPEPKLIVPDLSLSYGKVTSGLALLSTFLPHR